MTDFEKRCAEACQWCAQGNEPSKTLISATGKCVMRHYRPRRYPHEEDGEALLGDCTAPTKDQYIEELVKEIARLQEFNIDLIAREAQATAERESLKAQVESLRKQQPKQPCVPPQDMSGTSDPPTEHELRIKYQDIVYKVCNFLDVTLGNSPSRGTSILATETAIMDALTQLLNARRQ